MLLADILPAPLRAGIEARLDELAAAIVADPGLRGGLCFGQDWVIEAAWPL